MDVSIIIVNYNTEKLVIDCINSIINKTTNINYEIIVVDNNSDNGSFNKIIDTFPISSYINTNCLDIKFIRNEQNIGFGLANNEGFKQAKGEYLFCLNPDTIIVNNAIKILYDFMENNTECGACGGNLYDLNMKYVHSFGYGDDIKSLLLRKSFLKFFFLREYIKIKKYEKNIDRTKLQEVNHLTGADLMLRSNIMKNEIGGFSKNFFMYFEETELEIRLKRAGYKIFFVPDAKIIHLEGKSKNNNKKKFYKESYIEYYRLCYGEAWAEIAKLLTSKK